MISDFMFLVMGMMMFFGAVIIAFFVFVAVANWKLFEKAGKPGWASLIPVYNVVVLLDIIGYKWYYIFFFFLRNSSLDRMGFINAIYGFL